MNRHLSQGLKKAAMKITEDMQEAQDIKEEKLEVLGVKKHI